MTDRAAQRENNGQQHRHRFTPDITTSHAMNRFTNAAIAAAETLIVLVAVTFAAGVIAGDRYKAPLFATVRRFAVWAAPRARYGVALAIAHTVVAGRRFRRWWDAQGRDLVIAAAECADYHARAFIAAQAGDLCPAWLPAATVTAYTAPIALLPAAEDRASEPAPAPASPTIRELKAIARSAGIPNYSRLSKAALQAAIATT